jgi:hypothetical protein
MWLIDSLKMGFGWEKNILDRKMPFMEALVSDL